MSVRGLVLASVLATGCGTVQATVRPTVEVAFQSSTHLWDDGTSIAGTDCFQRTQWFLDSAPDLPGGIELRSGLARLVVGHGEADETRLIGRLGGTTEVDLRFGADHLVGRIGWRQYDLKREGAWLVGTYQSRGWQKVSLRILGAEKLAALPLAEQGVLLPGLLGCAPTTHLRGTSIDWSDLRRLR